jgi:hypothetical protein
VLPVILFAFQAASAVSVSNHAPTTASPPGIEAAADARNLFRVMPDNTFLLKTSYWFNF